MHCLVPQRRKGDVDEEADVMGGDIPAVFPGGRFRRRRGRGAVVLRGLEVLGLDVLDLAAMAQDVANRAGEVAGVLAVGRVQPLALVHLRRGLLHAFREAVIHALGAPAPGLRSRRSEEEDDGDDEQRAAGGGGGRWSPCRRHHRSIGSRAERTVVRGRDDDREARCRRRR